MLESWRWFGPDDTVSLDDIRQTGATDIVSALHGIPIGDIWPLEEILSYKALIENTPNGLSPLRWSVVESVAVHEDIKLGRPGAERYIDNFCETIRNLGKADIATLCYNFMPVIDWTRTDLRHRLPSGGTALRFDHDEFMAFDLFMLKRPAAYEEFTPDEQARAKAVYDAMDEEALNRLEYNIIAGLPGRMTEAHTLEGFRRSLARYDGMTADDLRENLFTFLEKVLPVAEEAGVNLAIHPDDPPQDMFGLPRIICTPADLDKLFDRLPAPANGITLCAGTYGSRPDNNLPEMAEKYANRIFFSHLRGVKKDVNDPRSFVESEHLDGDVDVVAVMANLLKEESRRRQENGSEFAPIFIRPDHGHQILDDLGKTVNPGYSAIGRLKGLAELRGVIKTLEHNSVSL